MVEVSVVNTDSPLVGFLQYKHLFGDPDRVFTFADEFGS
jgi:hypothetical protein